MAFDFKKEYKEFYMPKSKPEIVIVPTANYIAVRGQGNTNEDGGDYQKEIAVLYAVAYTLKMSYKTCLLYTSTSPRAFMRNTKPFSLIPLRSVANMKLSLFLRPWRTALRASATMILSMRKARTSLTTIFKNARSLHCMKQA